MTEEGRIRLLQIMKETIESNTITLDWIRSSIKEIIQLDENRKTLKLRSSSVEHGLLRLSEYNLLLGFISLDLCSAYRIYLKADTNYEIMYATKHLIVILNESYKKVYNYVWPNKEGHLHTKDRDKSFWVKDIGKIIEQQIPELKDEYDRLTQTLDNYNDQQLREMKTFRDMFVHYDDRPSQLFDVLCALDIQTTTDKLLPFMEILKQMMEFTTALQILYTDYVIRMTAEAFIEHRKILEQMKAEKMNNPMAVAVVDKALARLSELKVQYEQVQDRLDVKPKWGNF